MKVLIIGGGVAAFEAALAARTGDPDAEITVFSNESVAPYRRPSLSGMFGELPPDQRFYLKPMKFYSDNQIELKLDSPVTSIDTGAKKVVLADGTSREYTRLIIASGGRARLPQLPGIDDPRVMTLRNYADLLEMRNRLDNGVRKVVIVGGGVLGLELAESLISRGCRVTILEGCPALLPGRLDADAAKLVQEKLSRVDGLKMRFGALAEKITGAGIVVKEEIFAADLLVFSVGMVPNTEIAAAVGIEVVKAIRVDVSMRSSVEDVFAAGDAAELNGRVYGLYAAAREMGATAGANAVGGAKCFAPAPSPVRMSAFGIKLFSMGEIAGERSEGGRDGDCYRRLFYDARGELCGAVVIGDMAAAADLQLRLSAGGCGS